MRMKMYTIQSNARDRSKYTIYEVIKNSLSFTSHTGEAFLFLQYTKNKFFYQKNLIGNIFSGKKIEWESSHAIYNNAFFVSIIIDNSITIL